MPENQQFTKLDTERLCYLTTTGRVSGKPHEIEIWFAADHERSSRIFLLSGGRDRSDWVKNLRVNPSVTIRLSSETYHGRAAIIEGENEDPKARRLLDTKYRGWSEGRQLSTWARTALPVAIDIGSDGG